MDDPTSTSTFGNTQTPTHEQISRRAQELWEQYGRPSGRDDDIWLEAERQLRTPVTSPSATSTASAAPSPRLDDGNVAPGAKPPTSASASTPTTISSAMKTPRSGGKKRPGGGAK